MTAALLIAKWRARYSRYGSRRSLTDREMGAIIDWRKLEIAALPKDERSDAWRVLWEWLPKQRGER